MRRGDFDAAWAVSDAVLAARDPAERDDAGRPYHERWVWDGRAFEGPAGVGAVLSRVGRHAAVLPVPGAAAARAGASDAGGAAGAVGLVAGGGRAGPAAPVRPGGAVAAQRVRSGDHGVVRMRCGCGRSPRRIWRGFEVAATGVRGVGFCWQAGGWDEARSVPAAALRGLAASVDAGEPAAGGGGGGVGGWRIRWRGAWMWCALAGWWPGWMRW